MKIRIYLRLSASYVGLILLLTACGGERVTPTPVPASIVRPAQPAPVYGKSSNFTLSTPQSITITVAPIMPLAQAASITITQPVMLTQTPHRFALSTLEQPPSALGIATGGAVLVERPGGRALVNLPSGATVTITGKSADQRYVAVYTNDGVAGWVLAGQLLLFGANDLIVVQTATGPGLIATLLAQDMQPLIATSVSAVANTMTITTTDLRGQDAVVSEDRLNVRTAPNANATVMAKLNQGEHVQIISKNAAGDWLQVRLLSGQVGWVSAAYLRL